MITGASGLLGANALVLLKDKYETTGLYLLNPISAPGAHTLHLDLTQSDRARTRIQELQPDLILHAAAMTNVDACERDADMAREYNVETTRTVAEAARNLGAKLIHISTDAFLDGNEGMHTEEAPTRPANVYAQTKLEAELAVRKTCADALIIRTNIYGWNYQPKQSLAEWMLSNLEQKKPTPMFRDVFFTPILVNTLIGILDRMVESGASGIYNVASSRRISKLDFGSELCQVFGLDSVFIRPSSQHEVGLRARRASNMALDTSKLSKLLPGSVPDFKSDLREFKSLLDRGYVSTLKGG